MQSFSYVFQKWIKMSGLGLGKKRFIFSLKYPRHFTQVMHLDSLLKVMKARILDNLRRPGIIICK